MGETTIVEDIQLIVAGASDDQLAEHAKDAGLLGAAAREKLSARGHEVSYSDVNGVQECMVLLTGGTKDPDPVAERVDTEIGESEGLTAPDDDASEQDGTPAGESASEGE